MIVVFLFSLVVVFQVVFGRLFMPTLDQGNPETVLFSGKKPSQIKPLVLIPGLGGSSLEVSLTNVEEEHWFCKHSEDWHLLWVGIVELVPYLGSECFKFNIDVFFNSTTKTFHNHDGVFVRPKDYGGTSGVEYINPLVKKLSKYMMPLVEYFVSAGYVKGKSLRAANYDFRLGPQEWVKMGIFDKLKALIEETYELNDHTKVYLLGHSMGGPMGSFFLGTQVSEEWKEKYIEGYFSIAGSYDGGMEAVATLIYGKYDVLPVDLHGLTNKAGGVHWSIPYHFYGEDVVIYSKTKNYTVNGIAELFKDMGNPELIDIFNYVTQPEVDPLKYPPKVKVYCMNGIGFKTPKAFYYEDVTKANVKYETVEWFEDGDTTVFPKSSGVCNNWKDQQKQPVEVHNFKGLKFKDKDYHRYIIADQEMLDKMMEIMYKD